MKVASYPGPKARRGPGTHCVRMRVISPVFGGFVNLMDIDRRLSTYTNRVHLCHEVDCPRWRAMRSLPQLFVRSIQKVGKAGIVLKPEQLQAVQLQAVRYVYEGRNVFLWLLTGFVNPSAMKFSQVLRPSHKVAMSEGPGYEATIMFSLVPITKPLCGRGLATSTWAP